MSSELKNLSAYNEEDLPSASPYSFGIVVSEWHFDITNALYEACKDTLIKHGAKEENLHVIQVPGTFELPYGAGLLFSQKQVDAVITLGCVIRGETRHNEYINHSVSQGLVQLSILAKKPCVFGVITPNNEEQANDRAGGKHGNKGTEAAVTAIRMASLKDSIKKVSKKIGFGN